MVRSLEAASVDEDESEENQGEEGGLSESTRRESSDSSEEGAGEGYSVAAVGRMSTEEEDFDADTAREIERERAMSMDDATEGLASS
jgi:hypothetical protein